jgi:hypothetical protein
MLSYRQVNIAANVDCVKTVFKSGISRVQSGDLSHYYKNRPTAWVQSQQLYAVCTSSAHIVIHHTKATISSVYWAVIPTIHRAYNKHCLRIPYLIIVKEPLS